MQFRLFHILMGMAAAILLVSAGYVLTAYEFVPTVWKFVERRHPAIDKISAISTRTVTKAGIPGDPLNVAFVGSGLSLQQHMLRAGWFPADPITLTSSLRIAKDSMMHKPYPDAPVSDLFVNGQKQQLAFEQAEGGDPSKRHHVRFWLIPVTDNLDRPMWIGAATFDASVGLSHTTGQITHHIDGDVDRERDKLIDDFQRSGVVVLNWIDPFQSELHGKNGGGDHYFTDGRLAVISDE